MTPYPTSSDLAEETPFSKYAPCNGGITGLRSWDSDLQARLVATAAEFADQFTLAAINAD